MHSVAFVLSTVGSSIHLTSVEDKVSNPKKIFDLYYYLLFRFLKISHFVMEALKAEGKLKHLGQNIINFNSTCWLFGKLKLIS